MPLWKKYSTISFRKAFPEPIVAQLRFKTWLKFIIFIAKIINNETLR